MIQRILLGCKNNLIGGIKFIFDFDQQINA